MIARLGPSSDKWHNDAYLPGMTEAFTKDQSKIIPSVSVIECLLV